MRGNTWDLAGELGTDIHLSLRISLVMFMYAPSESESVRINPVRLTNILELVKLAKLSTYPKLVGLVASIGSDPTFLSIIASIHNFICVN